MRPRKYCIRGLRRFAASRKAYSVFGQVFKRLAFNSTENPCIFVNSMPKSGTHLLDQIVSQFSDQRDYGTFIASHPSITYKLRKPESLISSINRLVPGEIARGHLHFDHQFEALFLDRKILQFFIFRDPRDIVCSEANYLTNMNRWHRLHKYFKRLSPENAIRFSILGDSFIKTPVPFLNIADRCIKYAGWISSPAAIPVRFEDLTGQDRSAFVAKLASDYERFTHTKAHCDISRIEFDPRKSHTYRPGGGSGNWRNHFTPELKSVFKEIGANLLIQLGYETGTDW